MPGVELASDARVSRVGVEQLRRVVARGPPCALLRA